MRYDEPRATPPRQAAPSELRQAFSIVVAGLVAINAFIITFGMLLMFGSVGALGFAGGFATLPSASELLLGDDPTPEPFVLFPSPTPRGQIAPTPTPTRATAADDGAGNAARSLLRLWIFGSFFLALWPAGLAGYLTHRALTQP